MPRYYIEETRAYEVDADSLAHATGLYEEFGPEVSVQEPVVDLGILSDTGLQERPMDAGWPS